MSELCLINLTIKSIFVHSNGLERLPLGRFDSDNLASAITATVNWPHEGAASAVGAVASPLINDGNTDITFNFDLANPDGDYPPKKSAPAARLFRKLTVDDTDGEGVTMFIEVTETVKASLLSKVFAAALGEVVKDVPALVPGGAIAVIAAKALGAGIGTLLSRVSHDEISIIGYAKYILNPGELLKAVDTEITLPLKTGSKAVRKSWIEIVGQPPQQKQVPHPLTELVPANGENGTITLLLRAFAQKQ